MNKKRNLYLLTLIAVSLIIVLWLSDFTHLFYNLFIYHYRAQTSALLKTDIKLKSCVGIWSH